jgi:RIP metalloprotease RseP
VAVTILPRVGEKPTPVLGEDGKVTRETRRQATLGVVPEPKLVRLSLGEAAVLGASAPARMLEALGKLLSRPDTARDAIGGPITMAEASQDASRSGWYSIILMAASLSISLGIMNLLPVPPLDGGQMVVAFVEMLRRGRRLSIGLQQSLSTIGMFFVIGLTLLAFVVDLGRQAEKNQPPQASKSSE